ncbi:unnamed protein product [Arctogadus glacialis]
MAFISVLLARLEAQHLLGRTETGGLPLPLVFLSPAALPSPPHSCRAAWCRCRVRFIQQGVSGVDRSALPRTADSAAAALHAQAHALKAL